jgi:hypothetical protein
MTSDVVISSLEKPWLQLPPKTGKGGATETAVNYASFEVYRDLPVSERSISRVAQLLGCSEKLLEKWSSRFYWVERITAWKRHLDEVELGRRQQQAREKADLWIKREQDADQEMFDVSLIVIEKGLSLLNLPITERVVGKQDGRNIIIRPSRSAKLAADLIRLGFDLKREAIANALQKNPHIQETIEYELNPFSPTDDSQTEDSASGAPEPGTVPELKDS